MAAAEGRERPARAGEMRRADQLPGRGIHHRSLRAAAQERMEGILDRRGVHAAHERRCGDHSRSGERGVIREALRARLRTFAGGNCTVSLMLMAVSGLFKAGLVEWMTTMTYQAASGAGAAKMLELVKQMECLTDPTRANPSENALEVDRMVIEAQRDPQIAGAGNWRAASRQPDSLDRQGNARRTDARRMEGHGGDEQNSRARAAGAGGRDLRARGNDALPQPGPCIKLKKDVPLAEIEQIVAASNAWVRVIPNNKESSARCLTPTAVSGTLNVPIGRMHKLNLGPTFLGAFTVGDQLLWGAAEPLRRMLGIVREK